MENGPNGCQRPLGSYECAIPVLRPFSCEARQSACYLGPSITRGWTDRRQPVLDRLSWAALPLHDKGRLSGSALHGDAEPAPIYRHKPSSMFLGCDPRPESSLYESMAFDTACGGRARPEWH